MDKDLAAVSRLLKALADATRLRIVGLLQSGEVCVCDLHDSLKMSQPKVSRHLAYLRRAGVVEAEKRGLWVHYRLARQHSGAAQTLLDAACHAATHLPSFKRDADRLERETGSCVSPAASPTCPCCAPRASSDHPGQP
jgi:ArsR family transcriptional regulator